MTPPLAPIERAKLINVLNRLASDYDGERAAAGLLASRLLDAKGLSWSDVIAGGDPLRSLSPFPPRSPAQSFRDWRGDVFLCMRVSRSLTEWECRFLVNLQTRGHQPTPRQLEVLAGIVAKARHAAGAGRP